MTAKKVWKDADDVTSGITGRKPTAPRPPKLVVDAIDDLPVMSKGEKKEIERSKRAADLEEARVRRQLDKEEQRKRADQLKAMGEELLARGVASREILPKLAQSIIVDLGLRIASGEWEIKSAEEATKVAKIWYDVLRLEMGQATTINEQRVGTPEDRLSRLEELKLEAKRRVEAGLRAIGDGSA